MFIAKNEDLIVLVAETREELEKQTQFMVVTSIEETSKKYELYNGEYLTQKEIAAKRKEEFLKDFFEIPNVVNDKSGYYRKLPKGYSSAVESINSAFNMVTIIGQLPKDTLIFYEEPDFTKPEECTEEWLVEHQFKNETMTPTEFGTFYATFLQAWNKQEHL